MGKRLLSFFTAVLFVILSAGCGISGPSPQSGDSADNSKDETTLRILSGSENQELEDIIRDSARKAGVRVEMDYKGSVDIMRELEDGAEGYDAVWPASSIWISLGDKNHMIKHSQSISITPVVFGIRRSLAEELGFTGRDVSVQDILKAITEKKMTFCMTSATQSNSGASAYIGFLYALLGKQEGLATEDLQNETLRQNIRALLDGVDRSSGSSDWLKDLVPFRRL